MTEEEFRKEYMGMCVSDKEIIKYLEKENKQLKEQLKNNPYVQILQKEKSEMAEDFAKQIEKMKCCGNCKYFFMNWDIAECDLETRDENGFLYCRDHKSVCNKWVFKE